MRYIYMALISLLAFSCSKDNDADKKLTQWAVIKVEGPTSGNINQVVPITVYWPYTSGCDVLSKFEASWKAPILNITALGYSTGGICTMDAGIKTKIYEFTSASSGTFELRFMNKDNSYISHVVVIN